MQIIRTADEEMIINASVCNGFQQHCFLLCSFCYQPWKLSTLVFFPRKWLDEQASLYIWSCCDMLFIWFAKVTLILERLICRTWKSRTQLSNVPSQLVGTGAVTYSCASWSQNHFDVVLWDISEKRTKLWCKYFYSRSYTF